MPASRGRWCSLLVLAALAGAVGGRDDDPVAVVRSKLNKAKDEYKAAADKFREAVAAHLDAREDAARKDGNKKLVDQIKDERTAWVMNGTLPPGLPAAARFPASAARAELDKAFAAAAKDFLRLKQDDEADAAEKARRQFLVASGLQLGKFTYLASLKPAKVTNIKNQKLDLIIGATG